MNKQRRNRIAEALELISQARDILEEVKDEEQESYENLIRYNSFFIALVEHCVYSCYLPFFYVVLSKYSKSRIYADKADEKVELSENRKKAIKRLYKLVYWFADEMLNEEDAEKREAAEFEAVFCTPKLCYAVLCSFVKYPATVLAYILLMNDVIFHA